MQRQEETVASPRNHPYKDYTFMIVFLYARMMEIVIGPIVVARLQFCVVTEGEKCANVHLAWIN